MCEKSAKSKPTKANQTLATIDKYLECVPCNSNVAEVMGYIKIPSPK